MCIHLALYMNACSPACLISFQPFPIINLRLQLYHIGPFHPAEVLKTLPHLKDSLIQSSLLQKDKKAVRQWKKEWQREKYKTGRGNLKESDCVTLTVEHRGVMMEHSDANRKRQEGDVESERQLDWMRCLMEIISQSATFAYFRGIIG